MTRIRCEVFDQHGEAIVYVDELTGDQRRLLAPVFDLIDQMPDRDRLLMLADLTRQVHDQQAYERACAERGLLPC
jgi:hypothetical protein